MALATQEHSLDSHLELTPVGGACSFLRLKWLNVLSKHHPMRKDVTVLPSTLHKRNHISDARFANEEVLLTAGSIWSYFAKMQSTFLKKRLFKL